MAEERVQRKLTTILAADVEGYSRLMGADEEATLKTLKTYREIIESLIAKHDGRLVGTAGDAVLVEFGSTVEAVRCAMSIQEDLAVRNAELAEDRRMRFRIGINVGDVMVEGDDLFGDGVNVAARLEGLAEPGGICISGSAFDQVKSKLSVGFEDIGAQEVKNIAEPVPAFRVVPGQVSVAAGRTPTVAKRWRIPAIAAAVVVILAAGGVAWWQPWAPDVEPASVDKMAFPLPKKPSIAVLPFANLSGDKEQEYFADGLTEDIITSLASFPNLFVIARNSTNRFKGKAVDIRDVAHDLGVRYVLEGSVRRAGNTVRITAQLIDALSGNHIWAQSYDRKLKDIFALQDEITGEIGSRLVSKVATAEFLRRSRKGTRNPEAYDLYLRGRKYAVEFNPRANARAIQLIEQAIEKDPEFARAYAYLAFLRRNNALFRWAQGPKDTLSHAIELAQKAVALDPRDSETYLRLSRVSTSQGQYDQAIDAAEKAIALSPSEPDALIQLAFSLAFAGRGEDAVRHAETAMRLNPHAPWYYAHFAGLGYYMAKRFDKAAIFFERARKLNPRTHVPIHNLAAAYAQLGRMEEARTARETFMKIRPGFSIQDFLKRMKMKGEFKELVLEGFRKAGFPENPPLKLPDKPSIAVLPFSNLSGDKEQEYFSNGITNDIITDLSKFSNLFVIASTSVFTYKGKSVKVDKIGRDLGVRYVLEGSVQRAGDRVRINAQLIDAPSGHHLWAERYDRAIKDIFALQDEISEKIVAALEVKLAAGEKRRPARRYTNNLEAYDLFLRSMEHKRIGGKASYQAAYRLLERAIKLDPEFAAAHAELSFIHWLRFVRGKPQPQKGRALDRALEFAQKAVALEPSLPLAHSRLGWIYLYRRQYAQAIAEGERAIALDPGYAEGYSVLAGILNNAGRPEEGIRLIRKAMRLNPHYPFRYIYRLGQSLFMMGQNDEAIVAMERASALRPKGKNIRRHLVVLYHEAGRKEEAQAQIDELLRLGKNESVERTLNYCVYYPKALKWFAEGLRKAGYPEKSKSTKL